MDGQRLRRGIGCFNGCWWIVRASKHLLSRTDHDSRSSQVYRGTWKQMEVAVKVMKNPENVSPNKSVRHSSFLVAI